MSTTRKSRSKRNENLDLEGNPLPQDDVPAVEIETAELEDLSEAEAGVDAVLDDGISGSEDDDPGDTWDEGAPQVDPEALAAFGALDADEAFTDDTPDDPEALGLPEPQAEDSSLMLPEDMEIGDPDTISGRVEYGDTTLIMPEDMTYAEWQRLGESVQLMMNGSTWWAGDWAIAGEGKWGQKYTQAVEETQRTIQNLMDITSVCRKVTPERRVAELTYTHHRSVAPLEPDEQIMWLDRAKRNNWNVKELRQAIKAASDAIDVTDGKVKVNKKAKTVGDLTELEQVYELYWSVIEMAAKLAEDAGHTVGRRTDPSRNGFDFLVMMLPEPYGQVALSLPSDRIIGSYLDWEQPIFVTNPDTVRAAITAYVRMAEPVGSGIGSDFQAADAD